MAEYQGVWVYAEQKNGEIKNVTYELLGQAVKLAGSLDTFVSIVLAGHNIEEKAKELIAYGADRVYVIDDKRLEVYNDEIYCDLLSQLIVMYQPDIFLFGASIHGRSLAPRLASRFNTGLTADCTALEIDLKEKLLLQTRPAFGGGLLATIVCAHNKPQMATVRPKAMKMPEPDRLRSGIVVKPLIRLKDPVTELLQVVSDVNADSLQEADTIISVGRGIGTKNNIDMVFELAALLGGAVGATRAVVDAGWINYRRQIGQTGVTVAPKLYVACGISGAVQHLAGIMSSKKIIAINKDPKAAIFNVAHYGIVGDLQEVLPVFISKIKRK